MLPAGNGDSILIEYGRKNNTKKILIDAGPSTAFDELIKRFRVLAEQNAPLELFIVTHVDCDHIDGAITLLKPDQKKLKIKQVWFNSHKHLSDELGAPEGDILSTLIGEKKVPWNTAFDGKAVALVNSEKLREITLDGGLRITLLSPTRTELEKLKPDWEKACKDAHVLPGSEVDALKRLKEREKKYATPPDLLGEDTPNIAQLLKKRYSARITPANLSSIAFLAEYGKGDYKKSCLFCGDASPVVISSSLSTLLKERKITKLKIDALKVSHHGSRENTSPKMQKMLECKRFLISTDGKVFHHPHQEAIARIIELNGPDTELIFNYKSPQNEIWDNEYLRTEHHFKMKFPENNGQAITVLL